MACRVCEEPTETLYFGHLACRACASFFRRTTTQKMRYICQKNGNCDIIKEKRGSCRYCRMEKCISVGMIGDTQFWLKDCSRANVSRNSTFEKQKPHFSSKKYLRDKSYQFFYDFKNRINQILTKTSADCTAQNGNQTLCREVEIAYNSVMRHGKPKLADIEEPVCLTELFCDYFEDMERGAQLCMKILSFTQLTYDQKAVVYMHFVLHFPQMCRNFNAIDWLGNDVTDSRMVSHRGVPYEFRTSSLVIDEVSNVSANEIRKIFLRTAMKVQRFCVQPLKRLKLDDFERSYLIARCLWSLEGVAGVTTAVLRKADFIKSRLSQELHFYYVNQKNLPNYATRVYQLHNHLTCLEKISDIRRNDVSLLDLFEMCKIELSPWEQE